MPLESLSIQLTQPLHFLTYGSCLSLYLFPGIHAAIVGFQVKQIMLAFPCAAKI